MIIYQFDCSFQVLRPRRRLRYTWRRTLPETGCRRQPRRRHDELSQRHLAVRPTDNRKLQRTAHRFICNKWQMY